MPWTTSMTSALDNKHDKLTVHTGSMHAPQSHYCTFTMVSAFMSQHMPRDHTETDLVSMQLTMGRFMHATLNNYALIAWTTARVPVLTVTYVFSIHGVT